MQIQTRVKIGVDSAMAIVLLCLMGYQFWGEMAHEWIGFGLFVLFIMHHILNWKWHKNIVKGKYRSFRIFQLIINVALFLAMLGLMLSGIMLSNHVFSFLNIHVGMSFARILHMTASHWGFVLMALHLGLHWKRILRAVQKKIKRIKNVDFWNVLLQFVGIIFSVYGIYVFMHRNFLTYMLLQTHFVFMDFQESIFLFYVDYLAVASAFVGLAHFGSEILRKIRR